jgi:lipopolysaccharide biosynthesis glycosyltransferase
MQEKISIALSSDKNYLEYSKILISSFLVNISLKSRVDFFLFTFDEIDDFQLEDITVKVIKLPKSLTNGLILNKHLVQETYIRFYIPDILNSIGYTKTIYLDVDMIVLKNIDSILEEALNVNTIKMVDAFDENLALNLDIPRYYNAGLLIINLDWWVDNRVQLDLVKYANDKLLQKIILYSDQCIINKLLYNSVEELNFTYNAHGSLSNQDNIHIVHFSGSRKPWHLSYNGPYKKEYRSKMKIKSLKVTIREILKLIKDYASSIFKY